MSFADPDYPGPLPDTEAERREALASMGPDGVPLADFRAAQPGLETSWDAAMHPDPEPEAGG